MNVVGTTVRSSARKFPRTAWSRVAVVLGGLVACQFVLYGPSLTGQRLLLPLDLLAELGCFPNTTEFENIQPQNRGFSDEILNFEFRRRFAASEIRKGRIPLWNPYNFCGAPFLATNNTAVFSPFTIPHYLFPSPVTIAWVQLLKALVAGGGAYLFFKRTLRVDFWPAAIGAWCFPLGWFFVLWRGYNPSFVVAWLPWLLLATYYATRRPSGWGGPAVAVFTAVLMVSGQAATAAHVLLVSGFYAGWCLFDEYLVRRNTSVKFFGSIAAVCGGWFLGFLLSAPQNLPTVEYLQHSHRITMRRAGAEASSASGIKTWPQLLLPYFYGSYARNSAYVPPGGEWKDGNYFVNGNPLEGTPSGYGGCLIALSLAPLGWYSRRRRKQLVFWVLMAILGVAFLFEIPGVQEVFRLFPLYLLKNNRFVFLATWSLLVMAVVGMQVLTNVRLRWHTWTLIPVGVLICLVSWSVYNRLSLPDVLQDGLPEFWGNADAVQSWFRRAYLGGAVVCGMGVLFWLVLYSGKLQGRIALILIGFSCLGELLALDYGVNPQVPPSYYYPALKPLEELTHAPSGRICGVLCLPPSLNQRYRLSDIRGYDGVDPTHLVELLELCDAKTPKGLLIKPRHAVTQYFYPVDSPLLDMLNLQYRVFRGASPPGATVLLEGDGFWVAENPKHLPRAFVPARVESLPGNSEVLIKLARADFNPRKVAYVAEPLSLQDEVIEGHVEILHQDDADPNRVQLRVAMETPGLIVLSDLWFPGWNAYFNKRPVPIMRTNHALRGIVVPKGKGMLELRYEPRSFARGVKFFSGAMLVLGLWCGAIGFSRTPVGWLSATE